MNVLITGVEGQLGHTLLQMLQYETDWSFRGLSRSHFTGRHIRIPIDPYSKASWRQAFDATDWYPNVIVNTAAMTNVDRCEVEREGGWKSNAQLTDTITRIARIFDAKVIQISTDYVFDGVAGP